MAGQCEGYAALIESEARRNVGADVLVKYARLLGCSLDWLAAGIGEPPSTEQIRQSIEAA